MKDLLVNSLLYVHYVKKIVNLFTMSTEKTVLNNISLLQNVTKPLLPPIREYFPCTKCYEASVATNQRIFPLYKMLRRHYFLPILEYFPSTKCYEDSFALNPRIFPLDTCMSLNEVRITCAHRLHYSH